MPKLTPAADQFAALGLTADQFTPAMQLAIKQKWSGLPVDKKVGDLRDALAAVTPPTHATLVDLLEASNADHPGRTIDEQHSLAGAEHARLKRNAAVAAWRERNKLQAAIDARDLKFAALRAKRGKSAGAPQPGTVTGDAAPSAAA